MRRFHVAAALLTVLSAYLATGPARAQVRPHAGMMRYPAISAKHIAFSYANSLWIAPREGGTAIPLTAPPFNTGQARFSPDGKTVAFAASYDGGRDLYTVPIEGGPPYRVTHHPTGESLCGWAPEGRLVFSAGGLMGANRMPGLYTVPGTGGMPTALPVPYGGNGAVSADGRWLAYTPYGTDNATWKRYRGGMSSDIWLFDLQTRKSRRMTDWEGTDTLPMWHGKTVYFLSDAGKEHKLNIWAFDTETGKRRQVTSVADVDIKWPSIGPGPDGKGEIVYQQGPSLKVLDLGTAKSRDVVITVPGARPTVRTRPVDAARFIAGWSISPSAKRAAVEARGDIWSVPAKEGSPRNLTRTSGVAERDPSWSPDGKWVAYFSDATGEYELYVLAADGKTPARQVTRDGSAFRYGPTWSPDSKRIAYTDKTGALYVVTVETGAAKLLDKDPWANRIEVSWSSDSRWVTYAKTLDPRNQTAIWITNVDQGKPTQVTSGVFGDSSPVFDRKGDWLFYTSSRSFQPTYEDLGTTWIYRDTGVLLAAPLRKDVPSPYLTKSDEETGADAAKPADKPGDKPADKPADEVSGTWTGTVTGSSLPGGAMSFSATLTLNPDNTVKGTMDADMGSATVSGTYDPAAHSLKLNFQTTMGDGTADVVISGTSMKGTISFQGQVFEVTGQRKGATAAPDKPDATPAKPGAAPAKPAEAKEVRIDLEGLEARAIQLAPRPGRFGRLAVNDKGHLVFARLSTQGSNDPAGIRLFDLSDEKKLEKTILADASAFDITADGKKLLVPRGGGAQVMDASAGATGEAMITSGMTAYIEPREEWAQLVRDAWRIERDFFYVPNMHGVDWPAVYTRYAAMLPDAVTREDVSYIIGEMIAELNVGHAYYFGGDSGATPVPSPPGTGLLGVDFSLENGAYRIARIYQGGPWDSDARGPLSEPGVKVAEGDYVLAVNGVPVDVKRDPWAAFQGTAGRVAIITVSSKPKLDADARDVPLRTLGDDGSLRYRWWIEQNRALVASKTGGRVGYIYVPDTGQGGQNDLVRQFYAQYDRDALIIDERWNGGGQIPTRFIELLNRPVTNYWARRDGNDWIWPPDAHFGPKCMLVNGLAGSGGDAFPWYFRQAGLGKVIGTRTWGGLVGLSGNPNLIDGGYASVPTFGFYETDGTWAVEGHGVDPDIVVVDDPALMQDGPDPQLEAGIALMLEELKKKPFTRARRPTPPDRSGMGLDPKDR